MYAVSKLNFNIFDKAFKLLIYFLKDKKVYIFKN